MHTHFLSEEEVDAYLRDLAARLTELGTAQPTLWCPIGKSGEVIVARLLKLMPDVPADLRLLIAEHDRVNGEVRFDDADPAHSVQGRCTLVIDSSVHSGYTMSRVVAQLIELGTAACCSYSLVIKRSTSFVPSFWGVCIDDHDRAYFLLDKLPNNRLQESSGYVHLRRLSENDVNLPPIVSGHKSLDRATWSDYYYDMRASDRTQQTYVLYEGASVAGQVTISLEEAMLKVHAVTVDKARQGKKLGGVLLRWAETFARQSRCREISLWAFAPLVEMYTKFGYGKTTGEQGTMRLFDEEYVLMTKRVLYHI